MIGVGKKMSKEIQSRRIIKPTFEAVLNSQERLRVKLETLIKEDRCLTDENERSEFMRLLSHATLGLGINQKVWFISSYGGHIRSNVEVTGRWLAAQTKNVVPVPLELYKNKPQFKTSIHLLWQCFLDNLYFVFPLALEKSISMSKEKDETTSSKGYVVDSDE